MFRPENRRRVSLIRVIASPINSRFIALAGQSDYFVLTLADQKQLELGDVLLGDFEALEKEYILARDLTKGTG